MPTMIRPKGAGKRIAFSLLGIPVNMLYKKTAKERKRDDLIQLRQATTSSKIF